MLNIAPKSVFLFLTISIMSLGSVFSQINGRYYFIENDSVIVSKNNDTLINPWTGGFNASQISKIHLNNDSYEDLFVFDRTGNTIMTFVWDESISYWKSAPEYISQFPELEYWAILRDYNCDGKKDLFSYVSGGVGVWENTSDNGELSFEYISDPYVTATLLGGTVANLYVSKVDIPDINDIDGDGDLDVLTFGIIGSRLEYYQNQSQELGYGCDTLIYEIANTCWGHFLEDGSNTNSCTLQDTCDAGSNVANPKEQTRHSGSTVLSLDLNNDNVRDVLLGDVSFNNIVALYNDNKGVNLNTSMMSQDTLFPNNTTPVDLHVFPATYYEDVDMDGIKDLLASPNTDNATENYESIWYYKNYGTNSNPVFSHIENDFLQNETIEMGTDAYPVLFDYNNDGLLDLFVGNFGYYDFNDPNSYVGRITQYLNVGTASTPSFEWVTDDFASISSLSLASGIYPTFGDIDNDNDIDMLIGDYDGKLHLFTNSSGNLTSMNMTLATAQVTDDNTNVIDVGYSAKPQLFDIDDDTDLDIIIGEENGNINFYENMGSPSSYSFRSQTETLGDVDVSAWWTTIGNSVPTLFKDANGDLQLFVGSSNGQIHHYNNISGNIMGTYSEVDTALKFIRNPSNSSVAIGHLNDDLLLDMIVGNERGGLIYFEGSDDISLSTEDIDKTEISLYPNPAHDLLYVKGDIPHNFIIYDLNGKIVQRGAKTNVINIESLHVGIYIIELNYTSNAVRQKFIRQ